MQFRFSNSVLEFAKRNGISALELERMLEKSAVITHELGNRRYHDWVFKLESVTVRFMSPITEKPDRVPLEVAGPGEFLVYEECEVCLGDGCEACNYQGDNPVYRRAPRQK